MRRVVITAAFGCVSVLAMPTWALGASIAVPPSSSPQNLSPPVITGAAVAGRTLTGTTGLWRGAPAPFFAEAWLRCNSHAEDCKPIPGANGLSYAPSGTDSGHPLALAVVASNVAGRTTAYSKPTLAIAHSQSEIESETETWIIVSLGIMLVVLIGYSLARPGLFIGADHRWSTSKTVATLWTYLLASTLLGFVIAELAGFPQALDHLMHSGLEGQYGLLIGGPLGAAIAAKGIVGHQVEQDPTSKTVAEGAPHPFQLVQNDEGEADLGDFQYVVFNTVAIVFFLGALFGAPAAGLPHIPDVLLGLTSVAAVGYVAKKTLPTAPRARLNPTEQRLEGSVTITGKGLLTQEPRAQSPAWVLIGGKVANITARRPVPGAEDELDVTVPAGLAVGQRYRVVVTTAESNSVSAGELKIIE